MGDPQPIETSSSSGGSSESLNRFKYQVFLSFRGPDVRKGFIDHLYGRLVDQGLTVFLDNIELPLGAEIQQNLDEAIEKSQVSVITLSPAYADSRWCLDEVVKIMKCKASSLDQNVLLVFYNVEPRDARHQSGPYAEAFVNHGIRFEADMDKVSEYKTALGQLAELRGLSLKDVDGYDRQLVDAVVKEVKNRVRPSKLFVKENIIGRDSIVKEISMWLQGESSDVEVGMISGAGGMGKSTITQIAYNNNLAKFTGSSYVADFQREASEDKGLTCILKQIISDVSNKPVKEISNVPSGLKQLQDAVRCRKTLLILDDVDDLTKVEAMFSKRGFFCPGSKIIITTRNQEMRKVCRPVKEFSIEKLNGVQSDKLFYLNAFQSGQPTPELMTLSKKIIKYCDGLPLALCTLASSLYDEPTDSWEYMLEKLATGPDDTVQTNLKLSLDSIKDKVVKDLFLDIAHYFNGVKKDVAFTILDGLTPHLNVLFSKLVARCLVMVDGNGYLMMHQLIREMALEVVRQEAFDEPGHRSRLLKCEESFDVLVKKEGTKKVRCVRLDPFEEPSAVSPSYVDQSGSLVKISTGGFRKMDNLKFLQLDRFQLTGSYSNMPKKIKCLEWRNCQLKSLPYSFKLDELVVLHMQGSSLVRVWESTRNIMVLKALKVINLSYSSDLTEIPDLSGCPALERIILESCIKLVEVHESIAQLTKLTYLSVNKCTSLKRIPCSTSISVDAYGCEELDEIGDSIKLQIMDHMDSRWAEYLGYPDLVESLEEPRDSDSDSDSYSDSDSDTDSDSDSDSDSGSDSDSDSDSDSAYDSASISKVLYQYGIFSHFLPGDLTAKWFNTTRGLQLTYIVPFLPARRIRAFNICCVSLSKFGQVRLEVQVHKRSSTRKWLFVPILYPRQMLFNLRYTWLTHWPTTQHRELNAGDTLEVTFYPENGSVYGDGSQTKCGIEFLYDDEFEEEDPNHVQSLKEPSRADIEMQYDTMFRNPDLLKHDIEIEPGVYHLGPGSFSIMLGMG